jgi:NAD(P)-dependent dehydrogenase (short-subunit alcohol dehydrogenase family)
MELQNKTALITGAGANGGIGAAVARAFAREGADLVISGRDAERGEEARRALAEQGVEVRFVLADLAVFEDVERLAAEAGPVDILVNNAAAFDLGPTIGHGRAGFEESFDVNVRAPYFLTAALAPHMVEQGSGSIINLATIASRIAVPFMSTYGASKAALESLTRSWAQEFGASGVRVNAVAPGTTKSDKVLAVMGPQADVMAEATPLKRNAETEEIAEVVLFLASDRSSFVTGHVLAADAGRLAV